MQPLFVMVFPACRKEGVERKER